MASALQATVVIEWTVLKCRGPHPYATRMPDRFGSRTHDVQVGFPVPFACRFTGRVWRREDAQQPGPNQLVGRDGKLLIAAQCTCGAVSEYEVVRSSDA